jgi:hypothetical protein
MMINMSMLPLERRAGLEPATWWLTVNRPSKEFSHFSLDKRLAVIYKYITAIL